MSKKIQNRGDVLHVVFGESAGGTLIQALRQARRKEKIAVCPDNLSFGPIDPPDAVTRSAWMRSELRFPIRARHAQEIADRNNRFWTELCSANERRVIWMSRRSACEYADFLECVWQLADDPLDVVDLTDVARVRGTGGPINTVGEVPAGEISGRGFWNLAAPLNPTVRARYREMWRKLRAENAPFRVVAGDDLVSAPITFYDDWLVSCTVSQWRKAARVIGDTMSTAMTHGHIIGDLVLSGRLQALAAAGRLESQGDLSKLRFSEVRLPPAEPRAA